MLRGVCATLLPIAWDGCAIMDAGKRSLGPILEDACEIECGLWCVGLAEGSSHTRVEAVLQRQRL